MTNKKIYIKLFLIMIFSCIITFIVIKFIREIRENYENKKQEYRTKTQKYDINYNTSYNLLDDNFKKVLKNYPKFTKDGIKVMKLPKDLKQRLVNFWENNNNLKKLEDVPIDYIFGGKNAKDVILNIKSLGENDTELHNDVNNYVKQLLEEWTNIKNLIHTSTYGPREYKKGAILKPHLDRPKTHILSAIINISQKNIKEKWPLIVYDHNKKEKYIYLDDDIDLVLYESSTIIHGRPIELNGDSYVNMFIHFKTEDWDEKYKNLNSIYDLNF